MQKTIKYVKLACGKHWANPNKKKVGDLCCKCAMHSKEESKGLLQHNGTSWIALLGKSFPIPPWWPLQRKRKKKCPPTDFELPLSTTDFEELNPEELKNLKSFFEAINVT